MAYGRKTGGRDFKKGNPGGPGQPKLPEEVKIIRQLNKAEFESLTAKFLNMNQEQLIEHLKRPETTAFELMIGTIMAKAIKEGDEKRLDFFMNRVVGKPPVLHEVSGRDGGPIRISPEEAMTEDELDARVK